MGKPKPNPFEAHPDYVQLRALILNNKLRPQETAGFTIDDYTAKKMGMKHPERAACDSLRRTVKSLGLEADYRIVKYRTDPSTWAIVVTYEPPIVTAKRQAQ
jgi:hypothetical protein